jgi:hypothetical protein
LAAVHKQKTLLEVQPLEITKVVPPSVFKKKPRSEDRGSVVGANSG